MVIVLEKIAYLPSLFSPGDLYLQVLIVLTKVIMYN